jgi:hypothetical protein
MELWRQRQGRRREAPAEVTERPDFGILLADYLLLEISGSSLTQAPSGQGFSNPAAHLFETLISLHRPQNETAAGG